MGRTPESIMLHRLLHKAEARALSRLRELHRDEYETILDAERFSLGLPMRKNRER